MVIEDSVAIVTGAGSGMGAATAKTLARLGAKVVVLDLDQAKAVAVASRINGLAITCDVSDSRSAEQAIAEIYQSVGLPRICVNCAGISTAARVVGREGPMDLAAFNKVISVNLTGTFNIMRLAADLMSQAEPMADNERGVIINTASVAAYEGQIGQAAYSASKGGIVSMTLPVAREFAQLGIRVMAIAPGLINTPLFDGLPDDVRENLSTSVPFPKRLGEPEEYADLVVHIIENVLLNGSVIRLDGALRMSS